MSTDKVGEHQPWETLEFGTSALRASRLRHFSSAGAKHFENVGGQESFWDALKAENGTATTTPGASRKAQQNVTVEDRRWSVSGLDLPRINSQALAAAESEHRMSFRDGLRMFPKAIFWSAAISLAIIGEGFDTSLINSFYALDTFKRSYGVLANDGTYQISTKWQASLNNGAVAGSILGLLANGWLSERFGYRWTLIYALFALAAFIFLTFFAFNIQTLLAGQILCGIPWGICSTLAMSYAAEVMPLALRGYLIANINMCWIVGQIIGVGTLRAFLHDTSMWSYRIPFAIQWVWIVIVVVVAYLAPESPWWLVRKGRTADARGVLLRLARKNQDFNPDNVIAMMRHTDEVEKQLNKGKAQRNDLSYLECFRGANLRRTEIACFVFMTQNLCGLPLIGFAAFFYEQLGFGSKLTFNLTVGMHGLALFACLLSLVLIKYFGRRMLYLCGLAACFTILLIASILSMLSQSTATLWAETAMVILFIFTFDATVGPLTYTLVGELPSTRLRVNTIVLARIAYNICAMITNIISVRALNPLAWDLSGRSNWIWAGTCFFCLVYCWFRLPETKGLTYHELDILFEKRANARKFAEIQRRLDETGYFGFYDHRPSDANAAWR